MMKQTMLWVKEFRIENSLEQTLGNKKSHNLLLYCGSDVHVFDIELLLAMTSIK